MRKVVASAAEALADVLVDGMTIMSGGFGLCGIPLSLIEAIRLSGWIDEQFYLATYPEFAINADAAIQHYCERGWQAGLNPSNDFDTKFYLSTYHDVRDAGINPFWHYVIAGVKEARQTSPKLSGR